MICCRCGCDLSNWGSTTNTASRESTDLIKMLIALITWQGLTTYPSSKFNLVLKDSPCQVCLILSANRFSCGTTCMRMGALTTERVSVSSVVASTSMWAWYAAQPAVGNAAATVQWVVECSQSIASGLVASFKSGRSDLSWTTNTGPDSRFFVQMERGSAPLLMAKAKASCLSELSPTWPSTSSSLWALLVSTTGRMFDNLLVDSLY